MSLRSLFALVLAVIILVVATGRPVLAQPVSREPELADQIDTLFDRASTPANQQKFLSVAIFLLFGGGATYCVMRGLKMVVHIY